MFSTPNVFIDFCNQFKLCAVITDSEGNIKQQSEPALDLFLTTGVSLQSKLETNIRFLFTNNVKNAEIVVTFVGNFKQFDVVFFGKALYKFFLFKEKCVSQMVVSSVDTAEKLASMMRLSDGIAHNLRSPLMTLNNIADFMAMIVRKWQEAYDNSHKNCPFKVKQDEIGKLLTQMQHDIVVNVVLMSDIIDALSIYRQTDRKNKYQNIDIYELVYNIAKMIEYNAKIDVTVKIKKMSNLPLVYCIPADLQVVFANLFENAIEQMLEQQVEQGKINVYFEMKDESIQIKVRDNAGGIPIELLISNELFEPFATKKIGGTGLGLHSCFKIIEEHGGNIMARNFKNHDNCGAEFVINIPIKIREDI